MYQRKVRRIENQPELDIKNREYKAKALQFIAELFFTIGQ